MSELHLWIRQESRPTEQRVPIVPADAARLVADGVRVTVEESSQRVIPEQPYLEAGCDIAPGGSWVEAPEGTFVVGIKELPEEPVELTHSHVYFAHAYKGQDGAEETLDRFRRGGGELLDVEYLTLDGHRVVAFGYWAGYVGAALGVLQERGLLLPPLAPLGRSELDLELRRGKDLDHGRPPRALVIGAHGRSGSGAVDALRVAGCEVTEWDRKHTTGMDKDVMLAHDILVNCVVTNAPVPPFVTADDLERPGRRLSTIADVTCDVTSEKNLLPFNDEITTWTAPVRRVHNGTTDEQGQADLPPLDVIAIDNLPSLVPREASESFSAELTPLFEDLARRNGPWEEALEVYRTYVP